LPAAALLLVGIGLTALQNLQGPPLLAWPRFKAGDQVLVTGFDLGVAHDGGYAAYVRVPAEWVVPVPQGLSLFDAMAIGTAGFTAALSIVEMEWNGLTPC
jgi:acrylyl-CoA reductase (NADPH)